MKNRIFSIILSIVLSLPIAIWAADDAFQSETQAQEVVEEIIDSQEPEQTYKQPTDIKKIAKKFLAAMGGVAVSSFAIFFLLTIYNRVRESYKQVKTPEGETTLETPQDMETAVKIFLDKTRW